MIKYGLLIVLFSGLSINAAYGADDVRLENEDRVGSGGVLFFESLDYALVNSPRIRERYAFIEMVKQKKKRVISHFLPRLDLISTSQKIKSYGNIPGLESLLLSGRDKVYNSTSSFQLKLNIYNGGTDIASLNIANEQINEVYLELQQRKVSIALSVLESVHEVRRAIYELRIARLRRGLSKKELDHAERMFRQGRISDLSYKEAQYDYKQNELSLRTKQSAYQRAQRVLAVEIGEKSDLPEVQNETSYPEGYVGVLFRLGFDSTNASKEIEVLESKIKQARLDIRKAKSAYLPKVNMFASLGYSAISQTEYNKAFSDQKKDKAIIGFNFSWNLFDGFNSYAGVNQSIQKAIAAEANRDFALEDHRKKLAWLENQLRDSEDRLLIEQDQMELAKMKAGISREKFELERIDELELRSVEIESETHRLDYEWSAEQVAYYNAKLLLN